MKSKYHSKTAIVESVQLRTLQEGRYPEMVRALSLRSTLHELASLPVQATTLQKHERTLAVAQKHDLPIVFVGAAPAINGTKVFRGVSTDWGLVNIAEDPHFIAEGNRAVIPQQVLHELKTIQRVGLDFEAVYVAHEIEKNRLAPGQMLTLDMIAPPPPMGTVLRSAQMGQAAESFWTGVGRLLLGSLKLGIGVLSTAAAVGVASASFGSTAYAYDPILFGLHIDPTVLIEGRPLALWYYLASWTWNE